MFINYSHIHRHGSFLFFVILLLALTGLAFSAEADSTFVNSLSQPDMQNAGELQFGNAILRTIFALFLVILVLVIFLLGLRWLQNQTRSSATRLHTMKVQDTLTLGPKKQLFLVQVLDRMLLVGSAENSITLLCELTNEEKLKIEEKNSSKPQSFSKTLASQIAKLGGAQKS